MRNRASSVSAVEVRSHVPLLRDALKHAVSQAGVTLNDAGVGDAGIVVRSDAADSNAPIDINAQPDRITITLREEVDATNWETIRRLVDALNAITRSSTIEAHPIT